MKIEDLIKNGHELFEKKESLEAVTRRGQGVGGQRQRTFGTDYCVCPSCGHRTSHKRGSPCSSVACPKCGAKMVGEEYEGEVMNQSNETAEARYLIDQVASGKDSSEVVEGLLSTVGAGTVGYGVGMLLGKSPLIGAVAGAGLYGLSRRRKRRKVEPED